MEETRITSVICGSVLMSLLRAFLARFLSLMTAFRAAFSAADAREFIPWGMLLRLWCSESSGGRRVEGGRWRVEGGRSRQDARHAPGRKRESCVSICQAFTVG